MRVVSKYEHLGTTFSQRHDVKKEIRDRLCKAAAAHRKVNRTIPRNRHISIATRLQLLDALIISVQLYGSGNWPILDSKTFAALQRRLISWQRSVVGQGFWSEERVSDLNFQSAWKRVPLSVRLRKARLMYGFALCTKGPQTLLDFVTAADAHSQVDWLDGVRTALRWLKPYASQTALPDEPFAAETVVQWLTDHASDGPRLVKLAVRRFVDQEYMMYDIRALRTDIVAHMTSVGVQFASDSVPMTPNVVEDAFVCTLCARRFATRKQLCNHRWRAHQETSDERQFVFDSTCRSCGLCLWTPARLQQHLRRSRRHEDGCYPRLTRWCAPKHRLGLTDAPHCLSEFRRMPASRVCGPPGPAHNISQADADVQWQTEWTAVGLPDNISPIIVAAIDVCMRRFLSSLVPGECEALSLDDFIVDIHAIDPEFDGQQACWAVCPWCCENFLPDTAPQLETAEFQHVTHQLWNLLAGLDVGHLLLGDGEWTML